MQCFHLLQQAADRESVDAISAFARQGRVQDRSVSGHMFSNLDFSADRQEMLATCLRAFTPYDEGVADLSHLTEVASYQGTDQGLPQRKSG